MCSHIFFNGCLRRCQSECCVPALAGRTVSEDGFEAHLGTNHLGPFLLSLLLLPSMLQTARQARPSCQGFLLLSGDV